MTAPGEAQGPAAARDPVGHAIRSAVSAALLLCLYYLVGLLLHADRAAWGLPTSGGGMRIGDLLIWLSLTDVIYTWRRRKK